MLQGLYYGIYGLAFSPLLALRIFAENIVRSVVIFHIMIVLSVICELNCCEIGVVPAIHCCSSEPEFYGIETRQKFGKKPIIQVKYTYIPNLYSNHTK